MNGAEAQHHSETFKAREIVKAPRSITKNVHLSSQKKLKKSTVIIARLAILILKNILLVTSLALRFKFD